MNSYLTQFPRIAKLLTAGLVSAVFAGCTAVNTFPVVARQGDTIALAVGSADGMNRNNTTVEFVDFASASHDLTANMRGIFKLYPDTASRAWDGSQTSVLIASSFHEPWITILALDLPSSGLAIGQGVLNITSTATYAPLVAHINNSPISLEIIAGTGSSATLDFIKGSDPNITDPGDLTALEAKTTIFVRPTDLTDTGPYGAIEIILDLESSIGASMTPPKCRLKVEDLNILTGSASNSLWSLDPDGRTYKVVLLSPTGGLEGYEARFQVTFKKAAHSVVGVPSITSVRYFDVNGVEVFTGPTAGTFDVSVEPLI
ncbi:MAG TPA: hypothetical protein EYN15_00335 [Chromatiales bacterium]|nr:hypothetical protein [Chromatiales bacterium]